MSSQLGAKQSSHVKVATANTPEPAMAMRLRPGVGEACRLA